jgi:glycosyltransferase involved in cell wall biosynthesis
MPKVSVIVPNYRHAPYLTWRIDTVLNQTYRDFDLLILDDASTDNSREIIEHYRGRAGVRIHYNDTNSGSVFHQWEKGIRMTDSDYVWIAESDDWAEPTFLERLVPVLDAHPGVGIAYCQSWIVDREFKVTGHAGCWTDDLDAARWKRDFIASGREEISRFLLVKNTIPNTSAVLQRRSTLAKLRSIDASFRLCGDWMHWIRMLAEADLAFVAENLNFWRLQSSNARTAPPGVLEWQEGERVLNWACDRLQIDEAGRNRALLAFLRKCWQWQKEYLETLPLPAGNQT